VPIETESPIACLASLINPEPLLGGGKHGLPFWTADHYDVCGKIRAAALTVQQ
jgi:hypothetical protein